MANRTSSRRGSKTPPQGETGQEKFGQTLGREVLALAKMVRIDKADKPTLRVREDNFQFKSRIDLNNAVIKTAAALAFYPALVDFYEREYKDGVRPSLTTALLSQGQWDATLNSRNGTVQVVTVEVGDEERVRQFLRRLRRPGHPRRPLP